MGLPLPNYRLPLPLRSARCGLPTCRSTTVYTCLCSARFPFCLHATRDSACTLPFTAATPHLRTRFPHRTWDGAWYHLQDWITVPPAGTPAGLPHHRMPPVHHCTCRILRSTVQVLPTFLPLGPDLPPAIPHLRITCSHTRVLPGYHHTCHHWGWNHYHTTLRTYRHVCYATHLPYLPHDFSGYHLHLPALHCTAPALGGCVPAVTTPFTCRGSVLRFWWIAGYLHTCCYRFSPLPATWIPARTCYTPGIPHHRVPTLEPPHLQVTTGATTPPEDWECLPRTLLHPFHHPPGRVGGGGLPAHCLPPAAPLPAFCHHTILPACHHLDGCHAHTDTVGCQVPAGSPAWFWEGAACQCTTCLGGWGGRRLTAHLP